LIQTRRTAPSRAVGAAAATLAILALAFAAGARPALASDAASGDPLARMYLAVHQLDFQGSFVYLRGGKTEAYRIFHASGSPERERLVGLTGPRTEVAREAGVVTCLGENTPSRLFDTPGARLLPLLPDLRAGSLAALYRVSVGAEERVAGYRARRVDVVPIDSYRYGYRLWLEEESGLPLRSSIVDASRRTLEEYMFVTLDIGTRPRDSDLAPSANAAVVEAADATRIQPRWQVADLPPGFVLTRTQKPAQGDDKSEQQLYTDGLASVSVYIEPYAGAAAADRGLARGMLNILTHESGGWRMAAIGDVPRATLERMVRSTRPVAAGR